MTVFPITIKIKARIRKKHLQTRRLVILSRLPVFLLVLLSQTSCVKAQLGINLNADHTGSLELSVGMMPEAKRLAASQGVDPVQEITRAFSQENNRVSVFRWQEGDLEWTRCTVPFESLDELKTRLMETGVFERIEFVHSRGLFKDRIRLDGVVNLSGGESQVLPGINIDPTGGVELQILVRLPGEVIERSGVYDENADAAAWTVRINGVENIHVVSETWNRKNLAVLAGLVVFVGLIGVLIGRAPRDNSLR